MEKIINTTYFSAEQILITTLSGLLNSTDIENWKRSLEHAAQGIADNTTFKMLVNLHGFKAINFDVHKQFRTVMPLFLASYGYRIGYLDMFPESSIELTTKRGIRCVAMANVHQDETKMTHYETNFGGKTEKYFTDPEMAYKWISSPLNS